MHQFALINHVPGYVLCKNKTSLNRYTCHFQTILNNNRTFWNNQHNELELWSSKSNLDHSFHLELPEIVRTSDRACGYRNPGRSSAWWLESTLDSQDLPSGIRPVHILRLPARYLTCRYTTKYNRQRHHDMYIRNSYCFDYKRTAVFMDITES